MVDTDGIAWILYLGDRPTLFRDTGIISGNFTKY